VFACEPNIVPAAHDVSMLHVAQCCNNHIANLVDAAETIQDVAHRPVAALCSHTDPQADESAVCMQCGQAVGRQMMEQNRVREGRGGVIINMSSVNGVTAIPSIAGYNASKGGIDNLTK